MLYVCVDKYRVIGRSAIVSSLIQESFGHFPGLQCAVPRDKACAKRAQRDTTNHDKIRHEWPQHPNLKRRRSIPTTSSNGIDYRKMQRFATPRGTLQNVAFVRVSSATPNLRPQRCFSLRSVAISLRFGVNFRG